MGERASEDRVSDAIYKQTNTLWIWVALRCGEGDDDDLCTT